MEGGKRDMFKLPTDEEIKSCNRVLVLIKEPFQKYCLDGTPIKAEVVVATHEINIETDCGYYSFFLDNLISVQFLKEE